MLTIEREDRSSVTVLGLSGQLDALEAASVKRHAEDLAGSDRVQIVLDLGRLDLIDSAGVGALVSLFKQMRTRQGDVKIAALAGQPREIFRLLRLDKAFDIADHVEDAVGRFDP